MSEITTEAQDLEFIRDYKVSVARLWRAVTDPKEIAQWFGPEGVRLESCDMDLSKRGPWTCVMVGRESGNRFWVSGEVTHVRPPENAEGSVGFTWAWHGDDGKRKSESHVIFEVSATDGGARLRLVHRDLDGLEEAQSHTHGWLSTLNKLDTHLSN